MIDSQRSGNVERKDNRIQLIGSVDIYLLRRFLANLHHCCGQKYSDIVLDFSVAEFVHQQFMVSALPLLLKHKEEDNVHFTLELPEAIGTHSLFHNANWAHFIDSSQFDSSSRQPDRHLPATQFTTPDEQNKAVDDVISILIDNYKFTKDQMDAIEWSLTEVTDNVLNHAQSSVGGFIQVEGKQDYVEFVVADAGIGIPHSLKIDNAEEALKKSIQEGITRDSRKNAGNGLFGTYQLATVSKRGWFFISSDHAILRLDNDGVLKPAQLKIPHKGTSVICRIGLDVRDLFKHAFHKKEGLAYNYVEKRFLDDDVFKFLMVKECISFGTRESGRKAKNRIDNILTTADNESIEFDFADVRIISSSFADEVFGRLFSDLGAVQFMQRIRFKNLNSTFALLIDRAIAQRTALNLTDNSNHKGQN